MPKNKSQLDWCLSNEDRLKRIPANNLKSKEHIEKAKHNLLAEDYNIKGSFNDWAVSQAYYAMYHGLLAILYKFGYESKNHGCTISAVEHLIEIKKMIKEYKKNKALFQEAAQLSDELQNILKEKMKTLTINIQEIIGKQ